MCVHEIGLPLVICTGRDGKSRENDEERSGNEEERSGNEEERSGNEGDSTKDDRGRTGIDRGRTGIDPKGTGRDAEEERSPSYTAITTREVKRYLVGCTSNNSHWHVQWGKLVYPITLAYCSVPAAVANLCTQENFIPSEDWTIVQDAMQLQLNIDVHGNVSLGGIQLGNQNGVSGFTWLHSVIH